jgi:hypothetical protein
MMVTVNRSLLVSPATAATSWVTVWMPPRVIMCMILCSICGRMGAGRRSLDSEAAMLTIFAEFPEKINGKRALRHLSQG